MLNSLKELIIDIKDRTMKNKWLLNGYWILIGRQNAHGRYIFEPNGELIISLHGPILNGSWRHMNNSNSIILKHSGLSILYNYIFSSEGVMLIQVDGQPDKVLTFVNQNVVPDLNAERYVKNYIYTKNNVSYGKLNSGRTIEIHKFKKSYVEIGMMVTINGEMPNNGEYHSLSSNIIYIVHNGRLHSFRRYISPEEKKKKNSSLNTLGLIILIIIIIYTVFKLATIKFL
jgi:hypothetical protein